MCIIGIYDKIFNNFLEIIILVLHYRIKAEIRNTRHQPSVLYYARNYRNIYLLCAFFTVEFKPARCIVQLDASSNPPI